MSRVKKIPWKNREQEIERNKSDILHIANDKNLGQANSSRKKSPVKYLGKKNRRCFRKTEKRRCDCRQRVVAILFKSFVEYFGQNILLER